MFSFEGTDVASDSIAFLEHALQQAIPYSEAFTESSVEALKQFYALAREDVKRAERRSRLDLYEGRDIARNDLMLARSLANSFFKEYYERGQALGAPFREAGYRALDTLQDTLGMARPAAGSSAMAKALDQRAQMIGARERMRASGNAMINQLDVPGWQSQRNLQYAVDAGLNPQGILTGIRDAGNITPKTYEDLANGLLAPLGKTDFEGAELSTAGVGEDFEFGDGLTESEIDSNAADLTNRTNEFVNSVRQNAQNIGPLSPYNNTFLNYARYATPAYTDYYNARAKYTPASRSLLNLVQGSAGNPIPAHVYTRR